MKTLVGTILLVLSQVVQAQTAPDRVCTDAVYRQFDFWLGDWKVSTRDGAFAGRNAITSEQQGCLLLEQWQSAKGGTGMSTNHFDPVSRRWHQHWVGLGIILEMEGGLQGNQMILQGPLHYVKENRTTLLKGTWTPLPDGRVRQHFEESSDDGKTWTEWFDGYYEPASEDARQR